MLGKIENCTKLQIALNVSVAMHVGHGYIKKHRRCCDVKVLPIIRQFLLYDILEEYKFDMHTKPNSGTTLVHFVCANTTSLVVVNDPS